jgi:hypothetical protein
MPFFTFFRFHIKNVYPKPSAQRFNGNQAHMAGQKPVQSISRLSGETEYTILKRQVRRS